MRDIAEGVGIKAASLYNHFADKEQLYFAALASGFANRIVHIDAAMASGGTAEERLRRTVTTLIGVNAEDAVSRKLLHRELLDGDGERLTRLTQTMFKEPWDRMVRLFDELIPGGNGALTTAYVNSVILGYFLLSPVFESLDGPALPSDPEFLGSHITDLLLGSLRKGAA